MNPLEWLLAFRDFVLDSEVLFCWDKQKMYLYELWQQGVI